MTRMMPPIRINYGRPIYTLPEGTTITNAGLGALCMQCHHSRGEVEQHHQLPTRSEYELRYCITAPQGDMVEA
jgi:hypothetical protein